MKGVRSKMIFLFTEIYIDTAEIGPMKVSLRFTVDIIMQVFFSRQFHHCVLPCPGGCPGQGGDGGKTPPVSFSVLYIFIISFSTSVLFSKRRISVNLVDLVKSFQTSICLQKSALIPPRERTLQSLPKNSQKLKQQLEQT